MYVLTYKAKPQTLAAVLKREKTSPEISVAREESAMFICGPTIKSVRQAFEHWVGTSCWQLDYYNIRPLTLVARYSKGQKVKK